MNRYEQSIMLNTYVMKVGYVLLVIINLAAPCLKGIHSRLWLMQVVICLVWILGLLGGLGYLNQMVPILQVGIVRIIECLYLLLFKYKETRWWVVGLYVLVDVIYVVYLLIDKSNYEYVVEDEKDVDSNESV